MEFVDFRCGVCNKLLAKVKGEALVKCPRCNSMNLINGNYLQVVEGGRDNPIKSCGKIVKGV